MAHEWLERRRGDASGRGEELLADSHT